jgi:hypothetical protein
VGRLLGDQDIVAEAYESISGSERNSSAEINAPELSFVVATSGPCGALESAVQSRAAAVGDRAAEISPGRGRRGSAAPRC